MPTPAQWLGVSRGSGTACHELGQAAFLASFVESILPLGWPAASALAEHLRIEEAESERARHRCRLGRLQYPLRAAVAQGEDHRIRN